MERRFDIDNACMFRGFQSSCHGAKGADIECALYKSAGQSTSSGTVPELGTSTSSGNIPEAIKGEANNEAYQSVHDVLGEDWKRVFQLRKSLHVIHGS